jgi:hypothetical protein
MPAKKSTDKKTKPAEPPVTEPPVKENMGSVAIEDPVDTKKRARKPRGSKIVTKQQIASIAAPTVANIVLNLKCSMSDLKEYNDRLSKMIINPLEYNSSVPPEVKFYDGSKPFGELLTAVANTNSVTQSASVDNAWKFAKPAAAEHNNNNEPLESSNIYNPNVSNVEDAADANDVTSHEDLERWAESNRVNAAEDVNSKEMLNKLKQLKIQLYKNALHCDKKSACFWCTYDFDNAPCYIPKYEMDGTIYGYGSFCRPECAVAHLMKESIDDSTKFDRYHLLNQIYSKVYDCKKNIKPAPDPHYLLDKFYGNLTIQEYRKLLKTEHLLLVIDKPLTRILPELHEDNDDAFTKIYGIKPAANGNATGVYKVKRQSEQPVGPSKASIIRNTFGLSN